MNPDFSHPKHRPRLYTGILAFRDSASWARRILERWRRFNHWRALQRLELLNDHALRDIGAWREPESRIDEWWRANPPP